MSGDGPDDAREGDRDGSRHGEGERDRVEARLADLESRFAFLDDLVDQLGDVITGQQRAIDELRDELQRTRESLEAAQLGDDGSRPEPPPPHY